MAPPDDQAEAAELTPWRIRVIAAIGFTLVALVATAQADEPRAVISRALADEAATIGRASILVRERLVATDADRARRLVATARVLGRGGDAVVVARRRAAAKLLVARDLEERRALADELARLDAAVRRTACDAAAVTSLAAPSSLAPPARGTIVRAFGTQLHERSGATLARRGIDLEVEARAAVVASADGVVRYAGPIAGLDAGVIVDHGSYLTVVGKLGTLAVTAGATVQRGAPLGRAQRRRVYFEVRLDVGAGGRPIDPVGLLR